MKVNTFSHSQLSPMFSLDRVGMENMDFFLCLEKAVRTPAAMDVFINLIPPHRGIHMSRLYEVSYEFLSKTSDITFNHLESFLENLIQTQKDLASEAFVRFQFQLSLDKKSLLTQKTGLRHYPCQLFLQKKGDVVDIEIWVQVAYSSTCPCSAGLSQEVAYEDFKEQFQNQEVSFDGVLSWLKQGGAMGATPHAQRSHAEVAIKVPSKDRGASLASWFKSLIVEVEEALQTAVQTLVKRKDEQEFARLNAKNLMFCEDSCRRIAFRLQEKQMGDYKIKTLHRESLHNHDAVASLRKGDLWQSP